MKYSHIEKGIFLSRPNRFIAAVSIGEKIHTVHVKNTGRCKELLIPGAVVYLEHSDSLTRKTEYDLVAVEKKRQSLPNLLINMDSQAPNEAAAQWLPHSGLFSSDAVIRREVTFASSRFDFFISDGDRQAFLEVKGVTLEENGSALFPDAPTDRGIKHLNELVACSHCGYEAYILFVIQMKGVTSFSPNIRTHPEFGAALSDAARSGVQVIARDCIVTPDSMEIDAPVSVILN